MSSFDNFKEINEAIVSMPFPMFVDNKTFINKKNVKFDKGTLKYRDSDGIVYTAVGVRSLESQMNYRGFGNNFLFMVHLLGSIIILIQIQLLLLIVMMIFS